MVIQCALHKKRIKNIHKIITSDVEKTKVTMKAMNKQNHYF